MTCTTENTSAPVADLLTRYADHLVGQLRCLDRVLLHGTLVDPAHPGARLTQRHRAGFRPREVARFAQPFNAQLRANALTLAHQHGGEIEVGTRKNFRQEDRLAAILQRRGPPPRLVPSSPSRKPPRSMTLAWPAPTATPRGSSAAVAACPTTSTSCTSGWS